MLPFNCPYCGEPFNNEFLSFKNINSVSKSCNRKVGHKLKIFSRNGENPELISLSIFSNDNDKLYVWNFVKKVLHVNTTQLYWIEPKINTIQAFHNSLKRLSKLLIVA